MIIEKVSVGLEATVPLIQYGSIKPSVFISASLSEGESAGEAIKELSALARAQIAEMILPIALARLANTELSEMLKVVKDWEATKVLRMLVPHIDLSEHVTMGSISVEKALAMQEAGLGHVNGSKS